MVEAAASDQQKQKQLSESSKRDINSPESAVHAHPRLVLVESEQLLVVETATGWRPIPMLAPLYDFRKTIAKFNLISEEQRNKLIGGQKASRGESLNGAEDEDADENDDDDDEEEDDDGDENDAISHRAVASRKNVGDSVGNAAISSSFNAIDSSKPSSLQKSPLDAGQTAVAAVSSLNSALASATPIDQKSVSSDPNLALSSRQKLSETASSTVTNAAANEQVVDNRRIDRFNRIEEDDDDDAADEDDDDDDGDDDGDDSNFVDGRDDDDDDKNSIYAKQRNINNDRNMNSIAPFSLNKHTTTTSRKSNSLANDDDLKRRRAPQVSGRSAMWSPLAANELFASGESNSISSVPAVRSKQHDRVAYESGVDSSGARRQQQSSLLVGSSSLASKLSMKVRVRINDGR